MIFRYLDHNVNSFDQSFTNFVLKLFDYKDIWLFNCSEGCQFSILSQDFKINNLSKIIITDLHISNISGLLGLLSSLNLTGRVKSLHIYAPIGLKYYLDLGKKYSHTNFNYIVYVHVLKTGLIISHSKCYVYAFINNKNRNQFIFVQSKQSGTFFLSKAKKNNLNPGPIYGRIKKGANFLFPDGFVLDGTNFASESLQGNKLSIFAYFYYTRISFENSLTAKIVLLF